MTKPLAPMLKWLTEGPDVLVPRYRDRGELNNCQPGLMTISLVLKTARPAGLTYPAVTSPPMEPMAPPMACWRAVPPGVVQLFRSASSGNCAAACTDRNSPMAGRYLRMAR